MLTAVDQVERAHLRDANGFSPPVHRLAAPPELAELLRRYWIPVWSLPPGQATVQRILPYPVCQLVIAGDYAHLVGPASGLATKRLSGTGWAVGAMLQPAAGALLHGGPVTDLRDRVRDLTTIRRLPVAPDLIRAVRDAMGPEPTDPSRQARATELLGAALAGLLPVDEEGLLVNAVVAEVETARVHRVSQVCRRFAISERSLQRLLARRVGLSPKWLIQRRRLHEAAERLRASGRVDLARIAYELGYTDQAHFSRDFRSVTGLTPGAFAAEPRASGRGSWEDA